MRSILPVCCVESNIKSWRALATPRRASCDPAAASLSQAATVRPHAVIRPAAILSAVGSWLRMPHSLLATTEIKTQISPRMFKIIALVILELGFPLD